MIKILLVICVLFAIAGDAIRFTDSDGNFGIIINKKQVLYGIQDGAVKSYEVVVDFLVENGVFDKLSDVMGQSGGNINKEEIKTDK